MRRKTHTSHCDDTAGKVFPEVNFNNCGGKEDCVEVCPYNVFEMKPITNEDAAKLNLKGKIKTFFKSKKAYVINPEACQACGLCVQACPEKAVKLIKVKSV